MASSRLIAVIRRCRIADNSVPIAARGHSTLRSFVFNARAGFLIQLRSYCVLS